MWPFTRKKIEETPLPGLNDLPEGPMCRTNPDWIMTVGATPDLIRRRVIAHAALIEADDPEKCEVRICELDEHRHAVLFAPRLPVFDWVNLPGWLMEFLKLKGLTAAVSWMTSPKTGLRYLIYPEYDKSSSGDTALGLSDEGSVRIYTPEVRMCPTTLPVVQIEEVNLSDFSLPEKERFEITVDATATYGNADFVITDPVDSNFDFKHGA